LILTKEIMLFKSQAASTIRWFFSNQVASTVLAVTTRVKSVLEISLELTRRKELRKLLKNSRRKKRNVLQKKRKKQRK
jgi:ABC-type uncharacterized transport system involved in gliding motility auxiliary subunit